MYKYSPIMFAMCLVACGGGGSDNSNNSSSNNTTITVNSQQAVATEVVSNSLLMSGTVLESTNVAVASQSLTQNALNQSLAMRELINGLKIQVEQDAVDMKALMRKLNLLEEKLDAFAKKSENRLDSEGEN